MIMQKRAAIIAVFVLVAFVSYSLPWGRFSPSANNKSKETDKNMGLSTISADMRYDQKFGYAYFTVTLDEGYPFNYVKVSIYSDNKRPILFDSKYDIPLSEPVMSDTHFPDGYTDQDYSFEYSKNRIMLHVDMEYEGTAIAIISTPLGESVFYQLNCTSKNGGPPNTPALTSCIISKVTQKNDNYNNKVYENKFDYFDIVDSRKKLSETALDPELKNLAGNYTDLTYYVYSIDLKNLKKRYEIKDIRFYYNGQFYLSKDEGSLKDRMLTVAKKISRKESISLQKNLVTSSIYDDGFDASGRFDYVAKWNLATEFPESINRYVLPNTLLSVDSWEGEKYNFFELTSASGKRRALRVNLLKVVDY